MIILANNTAQFESGISQLIRASGNRTGTVMDVPMGSTANCIFRLRKALDVSDNKRPIQILRSTIGLSSSCVEHFHNAANHWSTGCTDRAVYTSRRPPTWQVINLSSAKSGASHSLEFKKWWDQQQFGSATQKAFACGTYLGCRH